MYKFIFFALVTLVACNPKPAAPDKKNLIGLTSGFNAWKLDSNDARKMILAAKGCKPFHIVNTNAAMQQAIDSAFPASKFSRTFVQARYLLNANETLYRSLRGMKPGDPRGNIRGYCTNIYLIRSLSSKAEGGESFYDILTVCPPPPDCNGDSLHPEGADTTSNGSGG